MDFAISNPTLVAVLVLAMVVLMALQTIGMLVLLARLRRKARRLEVKTLTKMQKLEDGLRASSAFLERAAWVQEKFPAFERKMSGLLDSGASAAQKLDENAIRGVAGAREKLREADSMLDEGLHRYARQTNRVHRMVRTPAVHISALLHGALAAFRHFASDRRPRQPATHSPDSDSFI